MEILGDFSTSVAKALSEINPNYMDLPGLVICGTHSPANVEYQIQKIREARENHTPFLGICFGHQLAAVEYARNVLGMEDATSEEFGVGNFIVKKLPELKVGLHDGESYWNNYEVQNWFNEVWNKEENFTTVQFHPEYQSSKDNPHPLLVKFISDAMAMSMVAYNR